MKNVQNVTYHLIGIFIKLNLVLIKLINNNQIIMKLTYLSSRTKYLNKVELLMIKMFSNVSKIMRFHSILM